MCLISCLIPVYNSEKYIIRLLKSLEKQTFKDFNVIIVNDGSTDNSLNIINNFINNSQLDIKVINQCNEGAASARVKAFENSDSPFVVFLDSDDYVDLNYLEILYKTICQTKSNICVSRISYHPTFIPLLNIKNININGNYDLLDNKYILPIMQCGTVAKIYRRESILLPDKSFNGNEDLSINHLNYAVARNISFTNNTSYHNLPNNKGLSARKTIGYSYDKILKTIIPLSKLKQNFIEYNMLDNYYHELEAIFIRFIFQRITDIMLKEKNCEKSNELISLLLSYLQLKFPNWRLNKYYISNYKNFEIPDKLYCYGANIYFKTHDLNIQSISQDDILKRYKYVSRFKF